MVVSFADGPDGTVVTSAFTNIPSGIRPEIAKRACASTTPA
jgi:hypothetical protein